MPLFAAFALDYASAVYLECTTTALFALDIYVAQRTTFRCSVNREYMMRWILFDVAAVVPLLEVAVFLHFGRALQRWMSVVRLLRLLKLCRMRLFAKLTASSRSSILLALLVLLALLIAHWAACALKGLEGGSYGDTLYWCLVLCGSVAMCGSASTTGTAWIASRRRSRRCSCFSTATCPTRSSTRS